MCNADTSAFGDSPTVTSKEIADLMGYANRRVKKVIQTLVNQGVINLPATVDVPSERVGPKILSVYLLDRAAADAVMARIIFNRDKPPLTPEEIAANKKAGDTSPRAVAARAARYAVPEKRAAILTNAKKFYQANSEKINAYSKKYYQEHKDERREGKAADGKKYYRDNWEEIRAKRNLALQLSPEKQRQAKIYSAQWYKDNKPRVTEKVQAYYRANTARIRSCIAAYQKANPEATRMLHRVKKHRRRVKLLEAGGQFGRRDVRRLQALQRNQCANCHTSLDDGYHIDHIIPVAKGGSNHPHNIELLCPTCNIKKSDKWPHEFAQENGRLL